MDFGIAKVIDPHADLEHLTMENTLVGTPEYMAPEALLASPDANHLVDGQYALGVTMYECLTGVVPFEGTYGEVVQKMQLTKMTPVTELRPDVPARLAQWIERTLRREPSERFADMNETHAALRALVGRAKLEAASDAPGARVAATVADSPAALRPQTRRRHARAPYAALARAARADGSQIDGRVEEISESGCQFVAAHAPTSGETVTLRVALPISGRVIEVAAVCRWARATRVAMASGFEFTSLKSEALGEIRKYVALMGGAVE